MPRGTLVMVLSALGAACSVSSPPAAAYACQRDADCLPGSFCADDGACTLGTRPPPPPESPANVRFTPRTGPVGSVVTFTGEYLGTLTEARIGQVPGLILSRAHTKARVLVMPGTTSGAVSLTNHDGTFAGTERFTVTEAPRPAGPAIALPVLDADDAGTELGRAVAIDAMGTVAMVGARTGHGVGNAWLFVSDGGAWQQAQPALVGSDASGTRAVHFTSVALSADGTIAAVGDSGDGDGIGATFIYARDADGVWRQRGPKLVGTDATAGQQGLAIAISAQGDFIVVGGSNDALGRGSSWAFDNTGDAGWQQLGPKITPLDTVGAARFSSSVAVDPSGMTFAIGAPLDDSNLGAVWRYRRLATTWEPIGAKLTTTGEGSPRFGSSIALSVDQQTFVVGSASDGATAAYGAAWSFGGETPQRLTIPTSHVVRSWGASIGLSLDAKVLLVSGSTNYPNLGGMFWLYERSGETWVPSSPPALGGEATVAWWGTACALSLDGRAIVAGNPNDRGGRGAAWVYTAP